MIWRLHFAWDGFFTALPESTDRLPERSRVAVALPPRAPKAVDPRVLLPPEAEALKLSSHVWAGFWLRGVQP